MTKISYIFSVYIKYYGRNPVFEKDILMHSSSDFYENIKIGENRFGTPFFK